MINEKIGDDYMDEFSFIESIKQKSYKQPSLIKGIGDDAAVFRETQKDIVTAVDTFVEDIHFSKQTMQAYHVGYRSLAANLSDMAAMGAEPAYYLVSIVIPEHWSMEELSDIFKGMKTLASNYNIDLIGGDTVSGEKLVISITVIGFVDENQVRYRHDAKAGDVVFVTGTLGDSQAGFYILTNPGDYENEAYYIKKHQLPEPQIAYSRSLYKIPRLSLNDISDGIANEAAEIAEASKVSITIHGDAIPTSSTYHQFPKELQQEWKYYGGEDFEILGTLPENSWPYAEQMAELHGVKVTKIGKVSNERESGTVYVKNNEKINVLPKKGYTHLSRWADGNTRDSYT
jgi:thiamine-monophosphate kinase